MSRWTRKGWIAATWLLLLAPLAQSTALAPAACQAASAASAPATPCRDKAGPPIARPAAPAPGVSQQVTLYCGASAPASAAPASAPGAECKKAADGDANAISLKLPGGIGLDFKSNNPSLTYLFVVLAVLLAVWVLWRAARKATDDEDPAAAVLLVLAGLAAFALGGLLGYWWKDDRVATLPASEVRKLVERPDFARELQQALLDNARAAEERGQLKARLAATEQELAVERAKAGASGRSAPDWVGVLAGMLAGAAGMAWSWHLARVRNTRLETAVDAAHRALSSEPAASPERSLSAELDGCRQRIHVATGLLGQARHGPG
ncbi:hypothetical protein ASC95_10805 [Pelomonas sp. Root1217]|uniref:hypothetical protein n=1 Tax=Pelomonas sp. Root1217 TaxID=1736430 RepID=UPI00070E3435|nr:hypothetical protein [Pelomonas sp. Root1217]KQV53242.1 hypothetical protein ASC95_10805 [Pelomonas sp. Root1217]